MAVGEREGISTAVPTGVDIDQVRKRAAAERRSWLSQEDGIRCRRDQGIDRGGAQVFAVVVWDGSCPTFLLAFHDAG